jgi:hypothetical protein
MEKYLRPPLGRTFAAVVLVLAAAVMSAEAKLPAQHEHPTQDATADAHPGPAAAPDMMAMRQQMQAEHGAADERLRLLVERMNTSTGQARIDAMAAVVVELVTERSTMRAHMDRMSAMPGTMQGHSSDTRKMSEQCPMMKETAAPAEP